MSLTVYWLKNSRLSSTLFFAGQCHSTGCSDFSPHVRRTLPESHRLHNKTHTTVNKSHLRCRNFKLYTDFLPALQMNTREARLSSLTGLVTEATGSAQYSWNNCVSGHISCVLHADGRLERACRRHFFALNFKIGYANVV